MIEESGRTRAAPGVVGRACPPVGVVLPVYNGEPYISRSIGTILAQEQVDFELVIADNCSTDGTQEICREFARQDARVRYIRRERNLGVIENHNRLAYETEAELIAYAAADDEYVPRRLHLLTEALTAAPKAVLAFSATVDIDAAGEIIGRWRNNCRTDHPDPAIRLYDLFARQHPFVQFYGVMRRAPLLRTKLQPGMKCSDRMLLAELALHGTFAYVPDELLRRRTHTGKTSTVLRPRDYYPPTRKIVLPNVDQARYLAGIVLRAPLSPRDRMRVAAALRPWLRQNAVPMARNVARAGIDIARHTVRRSRASGRTA